jgi:hypothetical protein
MWTKERPTKPGLYWLYGWMSDFCIRSKRKPELLFVDCRQAGPSEKPFLILVCHGAFLDYDAKGLWCPIDIPDLPSEEELLAI